MATIKSQMTLNDGMSAVLKKIARALDVTLASFEQVQAASGKAIDTHLIDEARGALAEASNAVDDMAENYRRAAQEEEKLNQSINQGASAMDGLLGKVTSMVAAYASIGKVKGFSSDALGAADVQIGAQVQLKSVMGNMGSLDYYNQVLDKAGAIQGKGIYGDEAMTAGAAEFATYFEDGEAILSMMDTLSNYAMGMSGGGALDSTAMVDYATGLGKIMSGSYDAMTKKGFEFSDVQKAIIEGSATEAQIVAELGAEYLDLSSDMQAAAVIGSVIDEGWAGLYETMSNAPEGKLIQLNNTLGDIKENVGAGIYPAVLDFVNMVQSNIPQIESAAMRLATVLGFTITMLTGMAEGAMSFGTAVADNWGWIGPIVYGMLAYLGAMKAAQLASAAAQWVMNAAMAASPVTWVIVGIVALISLLYAVVGAINQVTGSSLSATGIICRVVAVGAAFIGNTAIGLLNAIITAVWTIFVAPFLGIIEFVLNAANGGFNSFGGAVANLIGQIIGWFLNLGKVVTTIIDAIFGTNWTAGLESLQNTVTAWGKNDNAITLDKNAPIIDHRFEYGGAWDSGYAFGQGIEDKVGGLFSYTPGTIEDLTNGAFDGFMMDGLGSDVGDIADNTSGMAGALEVSGEELKYLRDIAERDAINRFTTAEVKVDFSGMTNKIDGSMDLDGVIRELTDGFSEALVTAAEGVHE